MAGIADLDGCIAIVGGGLAGLMTALELAPQPVVLISRAGLGTDSSSMLAQGGIAAAVGPDDSPDLHLADTLAAGAGLCDREVAAGIIAEGPSAIAALEAYGARFDRAPDGPHALGLEAVHSRRRIVHAGGDGSGAGIVSALVAAVGRCPSITVLTGAEVRRVLVREGRVAGLLMQTGAGQVALSTGRVVLASGGLGGLYDATTNPAGTYGAGVMMAARAGAMLADMEFVQFHPTALDLPGSPLSLISEAVRGEGAVLIDERGARFMADTPGAELAPRDVVARAIHARIAAGGRVYLDARQALGPRFGQRFPGIDRLCDAVGIDPARQPIPVRPAAHYHMGGIATDGHGRSSLQGLWAVGECAATGLHGANRLASNSLLEAAVMARRVARDLAATPLLAPGPLGPVAAVPAADPAPIRSLTTRTLGVLRDDDGLSDAATALLPLAEGGGAVADPAIVALAIAVFARLRRESRGAHARTDAPDTLDRSVRRQMTLDEIRVHARAIVAAPALRRA